MIFIIFIIESGNYSSVDYDQIIPRKVLNQLFPL